MKYFGGGWEVGEDGREGERKREREGHLHVLDGLCACLCRPEADVGCPLSSSPRVLVSCPIAMINYPG